MIWNDFKKIRHTTQELHTTFNVWKWVLLYIALTGGLFVVCRVYEIQLVYMLLVIAFSYLMLPKMVAIILVKASDVKRFNDITEYMEQLLVTFKIHGQITIALEESIKNFTGADHIKKILQEALEIIKTGRINGVQVDVSKNLTEEAFAHIEKEYPSTRLKMLHRFIRNTCIVGGETETSMEILKNDLLKFRHRKKSFQLKKNNIRLEVIIGIVASLGLCYVPLLITNWVDLNIVFTASPIYQVITMLMLMFFEIAFMLTLRKISGTMLDTEEKNDKKQTYIRHCYEYIKDYQPIKAKKLMLLPLGINSIIALVFAMLGMFFEKQYAIIFYGIAVIYFIVMLIKTLNKKKTCIRVVKREIEKEYPYWLLSVTLLLQTESVYNAVLLSAKTTKGIVKTELEAFANAIRENPNSLVPYTNFFKEFNVGDITMGMKVLYAVNTNGYEDMEKQLNYLAKENQDLMEQSETIRFENQVAGVGMLKFLPMVIAMFKMLVDLLLTMSGILTMFSSLT